MSAPTSRPERISVRPPAMAGSFYPQAAGELDNMLDNLLAEITRKIRPPKAIIAPHAGYIYSGPVAASVYANIKQIKDRVNRVVLLGPAHRFPVDGIALPTHTHFATPLGKAPVDMAALQGLSRRPHVTFLDEAHQAEHSLEVHIPFLQKTAGEFTLIPLLVGDLQAEAVADIISALWGGEETLVVVSSDLSHYHDYDTAVARDNKTSSLIEQFDYAPLGPYEACGYRPLRGLLKLAAEKQLAIETLALCNSGDTAGDKDRVVGYGAYALFEDRRLSEADKRQVFAVIHQSIQHGLKHGRPCEPQTDRYPARLREKRALFISLKVKRRLRGCVGTTEASQPLINAAARYAYAAAFSDPRFKPLSGAEYRQAEISLSLLTTPVAMNFSDEQDLLDQLRPNVDGLTIAKGPAQATFLPVVWQSIPDKVGFLGELKQKAELTPGQTPDRAWRFSAEYYA